MSSLLSKEIPNVVYTPASPLRTPGKLIGGLFTELWASRELIWILCVRDLKAMYRQSYLGYLWIFVPPLATSAIWLFLNSQRVVRVSETPIPYPAFVLVGTTLWSTFSAALIAPLNAINASKPVFMKLKVVPEAFIASAITKVLFDFVVRLALLIPLLLLLGISLPAHALAIPDCRRVPLDACDSNWRVATTRRNPVSRHQQGGGSTCRVFHVFDTCDLSSSDGRDLCDNNTTESRNTDYCDGTRLAHSWSVRCSVGDVHDHPRVPRPAFCFSSCISRRNATLDCKDGNVIRQVDSGFGHTK